MFGISGRGMGVGSVTPSHYLRSRQLFGSEELFLLILGVCSSKDHFALF